MKPIVNLKERTVIIQNWVFTFNHQYLNKWEVKASFNGLLKASEILIEYEYFLPIAKSAWLKEIKYSSKNNRT